MSLRPRPRAFVESSLGLHEVRACLAFQRSSESNISQQGFAEKRSITHDQLALPFQVTIPDPYKCIIVLPFTKSCAVNVGGEEANTRENTMIECRLEGAQVQQELTTPKFTHSERLKTFDNERFFFNLKH